MTPDVGWDRADAPRRARWLLLGLMLVAVAGAGALLGGGPAADAGGSLRVEDAPAPARPAEGPVAIGATRNLQPGALVPGRWRPIAAGPLIGRSQATMTWTGSAAVVWGGLADTPQADGAMYDPLADGWTLLPQAPLSPRFGHAAVWTGNEVVVAGGATTAVPGGTPVADLLDVAAFNPAAGRWRSLPDLPFPTESGRLFAGHGRLFAIAADSRPASMAMLEAGADQWLELTVAMPQPPAQGLGALEAGMVRDQLVIWNRHGVGAGVAVDVRGDVTDPAQWRPLRRAPHPLSDIAACCELVASGGGGGVDVITYDRRRRLWRPLGEGTPAELAVSPELVFLVRLEAPTGALDRRRGTPLRLPPAPLSARHGTAATWAGDRLLVWGGADGGGGQRIADGAAFLIAGD